MEFKSIMTLETKDSATIESESGSREGDSCFSNLDGYMKWFAFHPSQMTKPQEYYLGKVVHVGSMRTVWGFRIVQVPGECLFADVEAGTDEWLNESIEDS